MVPRKRLSEYGEIFGGWNLFNEYPARLYKVAYVVVSYVDVFDLSMVFSVLR